MCVCECVRACEVRVREEVRREQQLSSARICTCAQFDECVHVALGFVGGKEDIVEKRKQRRSFQVISFAITLHKLRLVTGAN